MYAGALAESPTTAGAAAAAPAPAGAGLAPAASPSGSDLEHAGLSNGGLAPAANASAGDAAAQQGQQQGKVAAVCRAVRAALEATDTPARWDE